MRHTPAAAALSPLARRAIQPAVLAALANIMGGGGNTDALFPQDDVADFAAGATHIPGQVTVARRHGERVVYFPEENHWRMPDGTVLK